MAATLILSCIPAVFSASCGIDSIIYQYNQGINLMKKRNYKKAVSHLRPLANAGFGPAQRQLAQMYLVGNGVVPSVFNAAFWANLSKNGGDYGGGIISVSLNAKLTSTQKSDLKLRLSGWFAKDLLCRDSKVMNKPDKKRITYKLLWNKRLSAANRRLIDANFLGILSLAIGQNGADKIYLEMVDKYQFYNGSRYDRYIGWKPGSKDNVLRLSISNFNDQEPIYFAKALMLAIKYQNIDIIKLLINGSADINIQDKNGVTPIMLAIKYENNSG